MAGSDLWDQGEGVGVVEEPPLLISMQRRLGVRARTDELLKCDNGNGGLEDEIEEV